MVLLCLTSLPAATARLCHRCIAPPEWTDNRDPLTHSRSFVRVGVGNGRGTFTTTITGPGPTGSVSGETTCSSGCSGAPCNFPSMNNSRCWCRITSVVSSTCGTINMTGRWVRVRNHATTSNCWQTSDDCSERCARCIGSGSNDECRRYLIMADFVVPSEASVSCPLAGACTNSDYRTIPPDDSCGLGWLATVFPNLSITGTHSNDRGNFVFGECAS